MTPPMSLCDIGNLFVKLEENEFRRHDDDQPYKQENFMKIRREVADKCDQLYTGMSISNGNYEELKSDEKDILAKLVIFLSQNEECHLWNNSRNVEVARELLSRVLAKYPLFEDLQPNREETIIFRILRILNKKLNKDNWLLNPMAMHTFSWCLEVSKSPNLSDYLDLVFTPPLLFLDHYYIDNRLHGLQCVDLILENTSPSELRMYGRGDVYYDAVFKLLYARESELISKAFRLALKLAKIVEKNDLEKWTRADDVFKMLLGSMEMESDLARKLIYMNVLYNCMDDIDIGITAHSKVLVRIFASYLELSNSYLATRTLDCLHLFMRICWTRIPIHAEMIGRNLLKFMIDRGEGNFEYEKTKECLRFLAKIVPDLDAEFLMKKAEEL